MTGFFASIFFIGILLIIISLFLILLDKKKSYDYRNDALEKKEDLVEVIKDAEQMLLELNKFSDYIITQLDQKNKILFNNIKDADQLIKSVKEISVEDIKNKVNYISKGMPKATMSIKESESDRIIYEGMSASSRTDNHNDEYCKKDNVISINSKHRNVFSLSDSGMNDIEIARRLNIGRGEVQLIKTLAR